MKIQVTNTTGSAIGVIYADAKNVLGRFRFDNPEPFEGRTLGIAKQQCRVIPSAFQSDAAAANKSSLPLQCTPILIEDVDDSCACNADLGNDGFVEPLYLPGLKLLFARLRPH